MGRPSGAARGAGRGWEQRAPEFGERRACVSRLFAFYSPARLRRKGCSQAGIRREWWGAVSRTTSRSRQRGDLVIRDLIALSTLELRCSVDALEAHGKGLGCGDWVLG